MSEPPPEGQARLQTLINQDVLLFTQMYNLVSELRNNSVSQTTGESVPTILQYFLDQLLTNSSSMTYALGTHRDSWEALLSGQSSMVTSLDFMVSSLNNIMARLEEIVNTLGPVAPLDDVSIRSHLEGIRLEALQTNARIGTPDEPGVNTVLGRLQQLIDCGCATNAPNELACANAFESNGIAVAAPGNEAYSFQGAYAKWPDPLPSGIGRAIDPPWNIPEEEYTGMFSSVWNAFYLYVQSEAPYFRFIPELGAETYETNKWVQVPAGLSNIAVVVDVAYSLTAFLCRDSDYDIEYGNSGCIDVVVPSAVGNEITTVITNPANKVGTITALAGRLPVFIHENFILGQNTTGVPAAATLTVEGQVYNFAPGIDQIGLTVGPNPPGNVRACFAE